MLAIILLFSLFAVILHLDIFGKIAKYKNKNIKIWNTTSERLNRNGRNDG